MRQLRIMLADDNPDILHHATHLLAQEFSEIEAVPDGESVLRNYEASKPDVVILDISMGKLSGIGWRTDCSSSGTRRRSYS